MKPSASLNHLLLLSHVSAMNWTKITGVHWCSGGGDWLAFPSDPFGAGKSDSGLCKALIPANWTLERGIAACEALCAPASDCLGFTLYPSATQGGDPDPKKANKLSQCCFRTGSMATMPPCASNDSSCNGTRCYEKSGIPERSAVTIAVGRRPYVHEKVGHVLISASFPAVAAVTRCSVSASLAQLVISNESWSIDIRSTAVVKFSFDLSKLPATLVCPLNVSIRCDSLGWSMNKYRDFQRFSSSSSATSNAPSSMSQVDHESRSILVDGSPFLMAGWYYSLVDNPGNLTQFVEAQARAGVNVLLLYTFPLLVLHERAEMQARVMAACAATGVKILMDIEEVALRISTTNTTQEWADFVTVVNNVKDHPSTLGYYMCDDCCGNPTSAKAYRALKAIDPYHITAGAVNGGCTTQFTDGEDNGGQLSLDVPMTENYDKDLGARTAPGAAENTAHAFPMHWEPIVNCPWSESSNQIGVCWNQAGPVYSPHQMRSTVYAGLVGHAPMPNLLFFDYFSQTEDSLMQGVGRVALEMQDLKPALLAPLTATPPVVTLANNQSLRARGYTQAFTPESDEDDTFCLHVIVLNIENSFQQVVAEITFDGLPKSVDASLPFEGDADRVVPVSDGLLSDTIGPNSVNVYRIGCRVAPANVSNLAPNPSFEDPFLLGGVTGWNGGRAGWWADDGHDTRARMFLDTADPQHGRYSLKVRVPTADPLVTPWAQDCDDKYYPGVHPVPECNACSDGLVLMADTHYSIRLWARSEPAGMELQILTGAWELSQTAPYGHTAGRYVRNQTLGAVVLNGSWQQISVVCAPAANKRNLQLELLGGVGNVFIDNTFIGANLSSSGGSVADRRSPLQWMRVHTRTDSSSGETVVYSRRKPRGRSIKSPR